MQELSLSLPSFAAPGPLHLAYQKVEHTCPVLKNKDSCLSEGARKEISIFCNSSQHIITPQSFPEERSAQNPLHSAQGTKSPAELTGTLITD